MTKLISTNHSLQGHNESKMMSFHAEDAHNMNKMLWERRTPRTSSMMIMNFRNGECEPLYFTKEQMIMVLDTMLKEGDCVIATENIFEVENPAGGKGFLIPLQKRKMSDNMWINPMCMGYGVMVSAKLAIFTIDADVVAKARDFSTKCCVEETDDEEEEEKKPKKKNPKKVVRKTKTKTTKKE